MISAITAKSPGEMGITGMETPCGIGPRFLLLIERSSLSHLTRLLPRRVCKYGYWPRKGNSRQRLQGLSDTVCMVAPDAQPVIKTPDRQRRDRGHPGNIHPEQFIEQNVAVNVVGGRRNRKRERPLVCSVMILHTTPLFYGIISGAS